MPEASTTAIVEVGNIGTVLARHLSHGGESLVLAAKDSAHAQTRANELGPLVHVASVEDAIAGADAIIFALWLDALKEVIPEQARLLDGKVVVDPSNPIGFDGAGNPFRTHPDGQSAGSIVAGLLPAGAHYAKAFGTLAAEALAGAILRQPRRAALFYATDDDVAATTVERLMRVAGFDPVKAGGLDAAGRIEAPGGDLHQFGLNGEIVDLDQALAALKTRTQSRSQ